MGRELPKLESKEALNYRLGFQYLSVYPEVNFPVSLLNIFQLFNSGIRSDMSVSANEMD